MTDLLASTTSAVKMSLKPLTKLTSLQYCNVVNFKKITYDCKHIKKEQIYQFRKNSTQLIINIQSF